MMREVRNIEGHMQPVITALYERFLTESAKVEELDASLAQWKHERLQGRPEYKLRIGDWRVLYEFDLSRNELHLLTVRHRREVYR